MEKFSDSAKRDFALKVLGIYGGFKKEQIRNPFVSAVNHIFTYENIQMKFSCNNLTFLSIMSKECRKIEGEEKDKQSSLELKNKSNKKKFQGEALAREGLLAKQLKMLGRKEL
ncbi:MAG: hypothetical protein WDK96_03850 [Candidatus Paceibacterota bacterium]|jgi:hypothetical protein